MSLSESALLATVGDPWMSIGVNGRRWVKEIPDDVELATDSFLAASRSADSDRVRDALDIGRRERKD